MPFVDCSFIPSNKLCHIAGKVSHVQRLDVIRMYTRGRKICNIYGHQFLQCVPWSLVQLMQNPRRTLAD